MPTAGVLFVDADCNWLAMDDDQAALYAADWWDGETGRMWRRLDTTWLVWLTKRGQQLQGSLAPAAWAVWRERYLDLWAYAQHGLPQAELAQVTRRHLPWGYEPPRRDQPRRLDIAA
jgi:hypothetical protein